MKAQGAQADLSKDAKDLDSLVPDDHERSHDLAGRLVARMFCCFRFGVIGIAAFFGFFFRTDADEMNPFVRPT